MKQKTLTLCASYTVRVMFVVMVIYGIYMISFNAFHLGVNIHNIDLSYNILLINNDLNRINDWKVNYRNMTDEYVVGKTTKYTDLYIISMSDIPYNFYKGAIGSLIVGFGLVSLYFLRS